MLVNPSFFSWQYMELFVSCAKGLTVLRDGWLFGSQYGVLAAKCKFLRLCVSEKVQSRCFGTQLVCLLLRFYFLQYVYHEATLFPLWIYPC